MEREPPPPPSSSPPAFVMDQVNPPAVYNTSLESVVIIGSLFTPLDVIQLTSWHSPFPLQPFTPPPSTSPTLPPFFAPLLPPAPNHRYELPRWKVPFVEPSVAMAFSTTVGICPASTMIQYSISARSVMSVVSGVYSAGCDSRGNGSRPGAGMNQCQPGPCHSCNDVFPNFLAGRQATLTLAIAVTGPVIKF